MQKRLAQLYYHLSIDIDRHIIIYMCIIFRHRNEQFVVIAN